MHILEINTVLRPSHWCMTLQHKQDAISVHLASAKLLTLPWLVGALLAQLELDRQAARKLLRDKAYANGSWHMALMERLQLVTQELLDTNGVFPLLMLDVVRTG